MQVKSRLQGSWKRLAQPRRTDPKSVFRLSPSPTPWSVGHSSMLSMVLLPTKQDGGTLAKMPGRSAPQGVPGSNAMLRRHICY